MLWRRSYDTPPPPIEPGTDWDVSTDPRYEGGTLAERGLPEDE